MLEDVNGDWNEDEDRNKGGEEYGNEEWSKKAGERKDKERDRASMKISVRERT